MSWKCTVCNLIWDEEQPPDTCPKCSSPGEKYNRLTEEELAVIERSRLTNGLYMQLLALIPELAEIAIEGVEDNLDPWCKALHQRILDDVEFWEKSILAEINGHVNKGKWG